MIMQNLVVDTNSLIQIISPRSPYHCIYKAITDGTYALCVTTEILEEYEEVLLRLMHPSVAHAVIESIIGNPYTKRVTSYFHFHLITSDPDDNKFVDCAVASNAKYLVTEDRHFDVLKQIDFPRIEVVDLDEFVKTLTI